MPIRPTLASPSKFGGTCPVKKKNNQNQFLDTKINTIQQQQFKLFCIWLVCKINIMFSKDYTCILSVERQKGTINIKKCSVENQKGAIAVQSLW